MQDALGEKKIAPNKCVVSKTHSLKGYEGRNEGLNIEHLKIGESYKSMDPELGSGIYLKLILANMGWMTPLWFND